MSIFSSSIFRNNPQPEEETTIATTTTTPEIPDSLNQFENAVERLRRMVGAAKNKQSRPTTPEAHPYDIPTPDPNPQVLPLAEGPEEDGGLIGLAISKLKELLEVASSLIDYTETKEEPTPPGVNFSSNF